MTAASRHCNAEHSISVIGVGVQRIGVKCSTRSNWKTSMAPDSANDDTNKPYSIGSRTDSRFRICLTQDGEFHHINGPRRIHMCVAYPLVNSHRGDMAVMNNIKVRWQATGNTAMLLSIPI
jgi:hypothetical protein